jgi:hypothetical protein
MSDVSDDQDQAEALDPDEVDVVDFPPEHTLGVGELLAHDVTAAGEYAPDNLAIRELREEPELDGLDDTGAAAPHLVDADGARGPGGTAGLVADRAEEDWDVVDPGGALTESAGGPGTDTWPAEEAAIHVVDESGEDGLRR